MDTIYLFFKKEIARVLPVYFLFVLVTYGHGVVSVVFCVVGQYVSQGGSCGLRDRQTVLLSLLCHLLFSYQRVRNDAQCNFERGEFKECERRFKLARQRACALEALCWSCAVRGHSSLGMQLSCAGFAVVLSRLAKRATGATAPAQPRPVHRGRRRAASTRASRLTTVWRSGKSPSYWQGMELQPGKEDHSRRGCQTLDRGPHMVRETRTTTLLELVVYICTR